MDSVPICAAVFLTSPFLFVPFSPVSTYVVQNVAYLTPIRGFMSATTLRSSHWNRSHAANQILDDPDEGRSRILVVQLQVRPGKL